MHPYIYCTARGLATLNKGDGSPIKKIGQYKTEQEAKAACLAHYDKASKAAANLGIEIPPCFFG